MLRIGQRRRLGAGRVLPEIGQPGQPYAGQVGLGEFGYAGWRVEQGEGGTAVLGHPLPFGERELRIDRYRDAAGAQRPEPGGDEVDGVAGGDQHPAPAPGAEGVQAGRRVGDELFELGPADLPARTVGADLYERDRVGALGRVSAHQIRQGLR